MNKRYRLCDVEEAVSEMDELIDVDDDIAEIDDEYAAGHKWLVCVYRKSKPHSQTGSSLYMG